MRLFSALITLSLVSGCASDTGESVDDIRGGAQVTSGAQPLALQGIVQAEVARTPKSKWKPLPGEASYELLAKDGNALLIAPDVVLNLNDDEDFQPTTVETAIVDRDSLERIDAPPINGFPHSQLRKGFVFGGAVDLIDGAFKIGATTKVYLEKQRRPNVVVLDATVPGVQPIVVSDSAPTEGERCRVIGYDSKSRPTIREIQVTMEAPGPLGFGGMEGPSEIAQGLASWSDAIVCNGKLKALATSSHTYSVINKSALNSQLRSMGHTTLP